MKIVYLIDSLLGGGKERQLLYLTQELSINNQISIISFNDEIFYKEFYDLPIRIFTVSKNKKKSIITLIFVYKLLFFLKPDIIHTWDNISHIIALPYFITTKVKVINGSIRYGGNIEKKPIKKWIDKIAYYCSDTIVANSIQGLKVTRLNHTGKSVVIHNGINENGFEAINNINQILFNKNASNRKVVMVGRFFEVKDYFTLIKAAKTVLKEEQNVAFYCIGDGPDRNNVEKISGSLKDKTIFFLGQRNDIPDLIKSFDIGVMLNNTDGHAEGISNAIMEYMIAGLPVVATNAGGNPEIIKDGITGFLVPPFDEKKVSEKILYLLRNQEEAKKMGCKGRSIIKKRFNNKIMSRRYIKIYKDLVG